MMNNMGQGGPGGQAPVQGGGGAGMVPISMQQASPGNAGLVGVIPQMQMGMQVQGMQVQGMQVQGMQVQGMQPQGMQPQGMQVQGMQVQGMQVQGIQGIQIQGMQNMQGQLAQLPQPPQPPQPPQTPDKLDNISKVKSLIGPLRESLTVMLKSAAQVLHQNHLVDVGSQKGLISPVPRLDKSMEEFYSLCDQIELHLKTAIACLQQAGWSNQHLPLPVLAARSEPPPPPEPPAPPALSYPQFLATVRSQVAYAKEIHDTLVAAAQNISPTDV